MKFNSKDILLRCRDVLGLDSDKALITRFGYAHSNGTKWRTKNTLPLEFVVNVASESGASLDYLIFGKEIKKDKASFENALGEALTSLVAGEHISVTENYDKDFVKQIAEQMRQSILGEEGHSKLELLSRFGISRT